MAVITDIEKFTCIRHIPDTIYTLAPYLQATFEEKTMTLSLEKLANFGPKDDQMTPSFFN